MIEGDLKVMVGEIGDSVKTGLSDKTIKTGPLESIRYQVLSITESLRYSSDIRAFLY